MWGGLDLCEEQQHGVRALHEQDALVVRRQRPVL